MFVGHGLLAFAVVGIVARRFEVSADRALALAAVAALFATLPDVDIVYGAVGLFGGVAGPGEALTALFETGDVTHRGPTHSLLVGVLAAGAFALAARRGTGARLAAVAVLAALVALAAATSGALDALVVAAFATVGLAVVAVARRLAVSARTVLVVALFGLLSHPFGDLLTGSPPDLLYPLDVAPVAERVALHGDATVHLLGAFAVELAAIWAAVVVFFELTDRDLAGAIDRRAALGAVYGAAVFVVPAPTVDAASPFVFSILPLGLVGALPTRTAVRPVLDRAVATGLAAVTLALAAYAVAYLLV